MATPTFLRTFPVIKEQSLLKKADATEKGNGNDKHIPLGLDNDGDTYRSLLKFALDWTGVYQIVSAHLVFKSTDQIWHIGKGTAREFYAQRLAASFRMGGGSEGGWSITAPTHWGNQPSVAGAAYTTTSLSGGGLATGRLDITGMVEDWALATVLKSDGVTAGGALTNDGLRLRATDEGATTGKYEIYGALRVGTGGRKIYLELEYIANAPPNAPIVTAPTDATDPIGWTNGVQFASTAADRLTVEFLFSDSDPADTCQRVELEMYGDAATDAAPGTRLATTGAIAPTALGPLDAHSVTLTGLTPRTDQRYRLRVQDSDDAWGPYTLLADGRVFTAYRVGAPLQSQMDTNPEGPPIYGSINSTDSGDHITGWEGEFYEDGPSGSVTLWAPGMRPIGGESTRSDIAYGGVELRDGQVVRWRHRHRNRDDVVGDWSVWKYTTMVAILPESPDACSPTDTTTKLTTRTPTLTIGHSSQFDEYQWRLRRNGLTIYDSGQSTTAATTSKAVTVPAGILSWGDGIDSVPLEWEAAIQLTTVSVLSSFVRFPIRINSLPASSALVTFQGNALTEPTTDPVYDHAFTDVDRYAYAEWPQARDMELREAGSPPGAGAFIERREYRSGFANGMTAREWLSIGQQLYPFTTHDADWADSSYVVVSNTADQPSGYSGNSFLFTATNQPVTGPTTGHLTASAQGEADGYLGNYLAGITGNQRRDFWCYGSGARLKAWVKLSSVTNLDRWALQFDFRKVGGGNGTVWWMLADSSDPTGTWYEVDLALGEWSYSDSVWMNWGLLDAIHIYPTAVGGAYTGTLAVRDLRIGQTADAKDSPTGDLINGSAYDLRARWRDDADAKASTTTAASSVAGAANIKVASVAGIATGDTLTVANGANDDDHEQREVTNVGTAGAGGTGITVSEGFTNAHASGDQVRVHYWGPWSAWRTFTVRTLPVVTANLPADTATVNDPHRILSWTIDKTQDHAVIRVFERVASVDQLVWQLDTSGYSASISWPISPLLLETGKTYAWEVEAFDTDGLSATTTRRTFTTSFTTPTELTGLATSADESESAITVSWTASTDPYLHHYRVFRRSADGWLRIDGGPVTLGDLRIPLTAASFEDVGARFGENEYRVEAHNGAQASDPAYVTGELDPVTQGYWVFVVPGGAVVEMRVNRSPRRLSAIKERFDPPGRGTSLHLDWGAGPRSIVLSVKLRPSDEGDLSSALDQLLVSGMAGWLKAPSGWSWEPMWSKVTDLSDTPQTGGMLVVQATFEATEED